MPAKTEPEMPVHVGEIWKDCDKRMAERYLRVDEINGNYAYCSIKLGWSDGEWQSRTRIRLDRFRPNSTGYKLVK